MTDFIHELGSLGPSLGSVVVIGGVCFFLIKMLKNFMEEYLKFSHEVSNSIRVNSEILSKVSENVQANTNSTIQMNDLLNKLHCSRVSSGRARKN